MVGLGPKWYDQFGPGPDWVPIDELMAFCR